MKRGSAGGMGRGEMRAGIAFLVLIGLFACTSPPSMVPAPLPTVRGAVVLQIGMTSGATQLRDLVEVAYVDQQQDDVVVQFVVANSETLWADLAAGQLDAIFVHHVPETNENWFNPVALDGLAVVVHPSNPVDDLSVGEVQGIFNGRITNWSALGGEDGSIVVVSRERGAGTRTLFRDLVMAELPLTIQAVIVSPQARLLAQVAAERNAIGYGMMGSVPDTVKMVGINGRWPTPNETGSQTYLLTTPLYFVAPTSAEPSGYLRGFLAWLQSPIGQQTIGGKYGRVR